MTLSRAPSPLAPLRRWAASSSLLLAAAAWSPMAFRVAGGSHYALPWVVWNMMVVLGLAIASLGITRRSLPAQVVARGMALWTVTMAISPFWSTTSWLPLRLGVAAFSAAALWLAAPGLHTKEARAAFSPVAYRRVFLSGATAAIAVSVSSALGAVWETVAALQGHRSGLPGEVWGPALLAIAYLTSAIGVLRMRAWGVLLGVATAAGSIVCAAPVLHEVNLFGLIYACIPGVILASPVVASWLARTESPRVRVEAGHQLRVGAESSADDDAMTRDAAYLRTGS